MVEMNETASILNNLSPASLVLLDEIGRGTATYDGISIAWAVAEFLHNHPKAKARTLFATHYHELNEMEKQYPRIKNYTVSVKEMSDRIIFLRKLVPGGSHHSFGIHVARMAGIPEHVVAKARLILKDLEQQRGNGTKTKAKADTMQLNMFAVDTPDLVRIREILLQTELDTLTPVDALFKLYELKKLLNE
jgi:DNA mismatch repair protein MutS